LVEQFCLEREKRNPGGQKGIALLLKCVNIVLWGGCASPGLVLKVSRLSAATFLTGSSVDGPELLTAFDAETI
jgi:hypothetical protein